MRITYDPEVDALSIVFIDATVTTEEPVEGITLEYDAQRRLAGIEILDAAQRCGGALGFQEVILENVGPATVAPN